MYGLAHFYIVNTDGLAHSQILLQQNSKLFIISLLLYYMFGYNGVMVICMLGLTSQSQIKGSNPYMCKISKLIYLCNNKNI